MAKGIIFTGIKHCGKSTQGKILAKRLGWAFFDTDDMIQEETGRSPRQIYSEEGIETFMKHELYTCQILAEKINSGLNLVIATGGGICNNSKAIKILRDVGQILFLQTPEEVAANRIIKEIVFEEGKMLGLPAYIASENPKTEADVRQIFSKFYHQRCKIYKEIAHKVCVLGEEKKEFNSEKIWLAIQSFL